MTPMLGKIEILYPTCNLSTIRDGRGGIFTWLPQEPIKEFNLLYFNPNKVRGNHFHPEFNEYFLIVSGTGILVTPNPDGGPDLILHCSRGTCFKTPAGTAHAFHAVTEVQAVSMLTTPWDATQRPIVHQDLIPFDEGYQKYSREHPEIQKRAELEGPQK